MELDLLTASMRWRSRRPTWRPRREPFNPADFRVEPLPGTGAAKAFIETHHYSASFPAALACYALLERTGTHQERLAGVAVFSVPIQPRAAASYGAGSLAFCDLGRFVLLDHVGSNAETWFLARGLRLLAGERRLTDGSPAFPLIVAYSDPVPRTDAAGRGRFTGHFGGIYRDSSALYLGRTKPRRLWLAPDGTTISERALSKLRSGDRGATYTYGMLRKHGAPARRSGEADPAYVARALDEGPFRRIGHGGNHVYAFVLGGPTMRRALRRHLETGLPRPTRTDPMPA
jgi:hypothetical protein